MQADDSAVSGLGSNEEGSSDSFAAEATVVADAASTSNRGPPHNIKKLLVADVVAAGGINKCSAAELVKNRKDGACGNRQADHKRLRQVENCAVIDSLFLLCSDVVEITSVTLSKPERHHGPFFIHNFANLVDENGNQHNGCSILLQDLDPRFVLLAGDASPCEAWLIPTCGIFAKVPSLPCAATMESKEHKVCETGKDMADCDDFQRINEVCSIAHSAILKNPSRLFKCCLLKFPTQTGLANKILSPKSVNGLVMSHFIPIHETHIVETDDGEVEVPSFRADIIWNITEIEIDERATEAPKTKKPELCSKAVKASTAALRRMNLQKSSP